MNRRATLLLFGAITLATLLALPSVAWAHPNLSGCTGCHGSASTTVVKATEVSNDGVTATYDVSVTSSAGGMLGWALYDGSANLANASRATGTFSVAVGKTYTLWAVDDRAGANSIAVSPAAPPPSPPPPPPIVDPPAPPAVDPPPPPVVDPPAPPAVDLPSPPAADPPPAVDPPPVVTPGPGPGEDAAEPGDVEHHDGDRHEKSGEHRRSHHRAYASREGSGLASWIEREVGTWLGSSEKSSEQPSNAVPPPSVPDEDSSSSATTEGWSGL